MPPLLETLLLLDERATPAEPAENMARDEALLGAMKEPVLRVYRWARPAVTFGYFLGVRDAELIAGSRPVMRRWTGGGIVGHGDDWTWSLLVPAGLSLSRMRPAASYGAIHGVLAEALADGGHAVRCVPESAPAPAGGLCFQAPAPGDVLWNGKKVAGAGQRRCRFGLLHQGSVSGIPLPSDFSEKLAARLAGRVHPFPEAGVPRAETAALVESRYGTAAWLRLR